MKSLYSSKLIMSWTSSWKSWLCEWQLGRSCFFLFPCILHEEDSDHLSWLAISFFLMMLNFHPLSSHFLQAQPLQVGHMLCKMGWRCYCDYVEWFPITMETKMKNRTTYFFILSFRKLKKFRNFIKKCFYYFDGST